MIQAMLIVFRIIGPHKFTTLSSIQVTTHSTYDSLQSSLLHDDHVFELHISIGVFPTLNITAHFSDDRLKPKKGNSKPHWASTTSRDQSYQVIDRPWGRDGTNASQDGHSTRGLTPMERWQKESAREQPYHNLGGGILKGGKGTSTAATKHAKAHF
jgi:hypothetical protein